MPFKRRFWSWPEGQRRSARPRPWRVGCTASPIALRCGPSVTLGEGGHASARRFLRPGPIRWRRWPGTMFKRCSKTKSNGCPSAYRAAFVLCYLEGRSRAEAAGELGIPENTLSSRLARARDRLQKRLSRRGVNLSAVMAAIALTTGSSGASIPPALIETTAQAAPLFALRQAVTGISSSTLQLTNGAMRTMVIAKTKWAFGMVALSTTLAIGAWALAKVWGRPRSRRQALVRRQRA